MATQEGGRDCRLLDVTGIVEDSTRPYEVGHEGHFRVQGSLHSTFFRVFTMHPGIWNMASMKDPPSQTMWTPVTAAIGFSSLAAASKTTF